MVEEIEEMRATAPALYVLCPGCPLPCIFLPPAFVASRDFYWQQRVPFAKWHRAPSTQRENSGAVFNKGFFSYVSQNQILSLKTWVIGQRRYCSGDARFRGSHIFKRG